MASTQPNLLRDLSAVPGHRIALICGATRLTYADFAEKANDVAGFLIRKGIQPGDRVGIGALAPAEFLAAVYGCFKTGAVAVPLAGNDPTATEAIRTEAGIGCVVLDLPQKAVTALPAHEHREAMILFTSGTTTGVRKGVILGHAGISSTAAFMNQRMGVDDSIVECVFAPIDHAFGFGRCHAVFMAGGTIVLSEGPVNFQWLYGALQAHGCNALSSVPAVLSSVLRASPARLKAAAPHLRWLQTGAMRFDRSFRDQLCATFPDAGLWLHYGLSEAMRATFVNLNAEPAKRHTEGRPSDGVEIGIFDADGHRLPNGETGTIRLKGRCLALGYTNDSMWRSNFRGGWFVTSDLGFIDEDGYLVFVGRSDDVINTNGYLVHPDEVERRLGRILGNIPYSVVGMRDPNGIRDNLIVLCIEGNSSPTSVEIAAQFDRAESHMVPHRIVHVPHLPRTRTGKVVRTQLAQSLAGTDQGSRKQ